MDHARRVAAAAHELDGLLAALAAGPLTAPVPTCPDWNARDLATHVGWFCLRWRDHLRGGGYEDRLRPEDVTVPEGDTATLDWVRAMANEMLTELRALPADAEVWAWIPENQTAGFVARRCAHELAIHRYDAQSARGSCGPIAPDVAADGIDEVLDTLWRARYPKGVAAGQTVHLHGTDDPAVLAELDIGGVEWLVRLEPDAPVVTREHAKGDLALRAPVSDLELLLYGRPPLGEVQRFGDESVLDVWRSVFRF